MCFSPTRAHGKQLARIDQMWSKLDLAEHLSARRLNVLVTIGTPAALPQATGWQLVKAKPIGKWSIFNLQPEKP
jgi:hypothetical protein